MVFPGSDDVFVGIKHALALGECHGPFTPMLWYLPGCEMYVVFQSYYFSTLPGNGERDV